VKAPAPCSTEGGDKLVMVGTTSGAAARAQVCPGAVATEAAARPAPARHTLAAGNPLDAPQLAIGRMDWAQAGSTLLSTSQSTSNRLLSRRRVAKTHVEVFMREAEKWWIKKEIIEVWSTVGAPQNLGS